MFGSKLRTQNFRETLPALGPRTISESGGALKSPPGYSESAKTGYRDTAHDAASNGTDLPEDKLQTILLLVGKSIDDFRSDVGKLRALYSEMGVSRLTGATEGQTVSGRSFRESIMENRGMQRS
jgi:hypothetical protein